MTEPATPHPATDAAAHPATRPALTDVPPRLTRIHAAEALAVFILGAVLMHSIHGGFSGVPSGERGVPGHDSFYHIKMAAMIPEYGLVYQFPWLQFCYFTEKGHDFVSHHYGFHMLLVPFVAVSHWLTGDYLAGGRWAIAACFGAVLMLFHLLLITERVPWRWLWLLLFVLMPFQFFTRHAFIRAISPSLMFMLLILLLIFRRRYGWAGLAVAAYTHLYLGGVIFAPLIVGLYVVATVIGPAGGRESPWRLILWTAGGWIAGVLTYPYFNGMLEFLQLQVFGSGLSPDISVGREWKPYKGTWFFAMMSGPLLITWIVALCLRIRFGPRATGRELALVLMHVAFLTLTLKARRFIEYWPMFCLLSAALLSAPVIRDLVAWAESKAGPAGRRHIVWPQRIGGALALVCAAGIVVASPPWHEIRDTARCGYDLPAIRSAMTFLREHSNPGDVVFTDDWDIFPVYFYYNAYNHFIVGLDPEFTHARRPELWERYVKISRGQVPTHINVETASADGTGKTARRVNVTLEDIRTHFGARFVITDQDHTALARKLDKAPSFAKLIYPTNSFKESRKAPYLIFEIIPQPPTEPRP